jgi:sulfur relay (sulfurtransferase) DsrF/TusC family protein
MSLTVAVVIRVDPLKTHRAAEALRIALGLTTGNNPLTVFLLDGAPALLQPDTDDLVDLETVEKYLPTLKELNIPFVLPLDTDSRFHIDSGYNIRTVAHEEIATLISQHDRVLAF